MTMSRNEDPSDAIKSIEWRVKRFMDLSVEEVHELFRLRQRVFIVEQVCVFNEIDGFDSQALHVMGWSVQDNPHLLACARILPAGARMTAVSIGRVVTCPSVRTDATGRRVSGGVGRELMLQTLGAIRSTYGQVPIELSGQAHLQKFYGDLGFVTQGEPFDEDGIAHVVMRRP